MTDRKVLSAVHNRVAILTLNDPDVRNALSIDMVHEIRATFDWLEDDPDVGAVVITGQPPAFCSGANLGQLGASNKEGLLQVYEGFLRVARSTLPTIAAVNGPAVGAGMNMALCCDLCIAGKKAVFDSRFLKLNLHPGGGHTWLLQRATNPQTARAMTLFGETLDGERAAEAGLAWRCVDDANLLREARTLAERAASAPPELLNRIKRTLVAVSNVESHDDAISHELGEQVWSMQQPEFTEKIHELTRRPKE